MQRVLLVDDDPLVLRIYREALSRHGFEVVTADDGVAAVRSLRNAKPDVVVLDLLMPRLSGAEVVRFMQDQPELQEVPVIILSNAYMDTLAREAAVSGAHKGLVKTRCTPSLLIDTIRDLFAGGKSSGDPSTLLAAPRSEPPAAPAPPAPARPAPPPAAPPTGNTSVFARSAPTAPGNDSGIDRDLKAKARKEFLAAAASKIAHVRSLFEVFQRAAATPDRALRLEALYRRVHFLGAEAGLADCSGLALLLGSLEALLLQLMDKPARLTPSVERTLRLGIDALSELADRPAPNAAGGPKGAAAVLVVDDDAISNNLAVSALRHVGLRATSFEQPAAALEHLKQRRYDLLLLDIQMPGMTGFDFCRSLRTIAGYERTPVIYVTGHTDFNHLARSLDAGAEDLIAKPVLPMELAVKVMIHLLRRAGISNPG